MNTYLLLCIVYHKKKDELSKFGQKLSWKSRKKYIF